MKGNSYQEGQNAVEDDDEMIDIRKADENMENEGNESTNVEEESTRIKKQKMSTICFILVKSSTGITTNYKSKVTLSLSTIEC